MPSALLWAYSAEENFIISAYRSVCGRSGRPFSQEGGVKANAVYLYDFSCDKREIKTVIPLIMARAQRQRPPPVAETGRSCWGSGQQDASAAQGTKRMLGAATRQAEAIPNRPGTKRGRCTVFVQRPLCLWSLIVRMAGAAAVRCCLRPVKNYSSSLPENLLMT